MGLRFKKSIKLAPGVKLNLNKNSSSITFGSKGIHHTINSKGNHTSTVGVPGTGLSYSKTSSSKTSFKSSVSTVESTEPPNKKIGCLKGCAVWFLILVIFCIILNYAWIPGIIAIIYLFKKCPKSGQRTLRIAVCLVLTIFSFLIFIGSSSNDDISSIEAVLNSDEYFVNETIEIFFTINPVNAVVETLEISKNDICTFNYSDDGSTMVFDQPGYYTFYFIANGKENSNIISVNIVDPSYKSNSYETNFETETSIETEMQSESQTEPQTESQTEPQTESQTESQTQEVNVWISSSGSKYHSRSGCSGMDNPSEVSKTSAINMGYEPCKRCY